MAQSELFLDTSHFLSLSDEVILNVVDDIDRPADLVSLASSCKRLYGIISPTDTTGLGQLKCRQISISIDDEESLRKLATPALAKCVRKLHLRGILPTEWDTYFAAHRWRTTIENYDTFWTVLSPDGRYKSGLVNSILRGLANLRVLLIDDLTFAPDDGLFVGLESACPLLEKISLRSYRYLSFDVDTEAADTLDDAKQKSIFSMFSGIQDSNLSSLDIVVQIPAYGTPNPYRMVQDHVRSLLMSHSQLRHLSIMISEVIPDQLFEALKFPLLRSFCLSETVNSEDFEFLEWTAADTFLENHPTLEEVRIDDNIFWTFTEDFSQSLPNLKVFGANPDDISPLLEAMPNKGHRPLRWLRLSAVELYVAGSTILEGMQGLIVLDLVCDLDEVLPTLSEFRTTLRKLETLSVSLKDGPDSFDHYEALTERARYILPDFASTCLSRFPSLRCLKGFFTGASLCMLFSVNNDILLDSHGAYKRVLRRLSEACPTLELVDNWRRRELPSSWELDREEEQQILWPPFDMRWQHSYGIPGSSRALKHTSSRVGSQ